MTELDAEVLPEVLDVINTYGRAVSFVVRSKSYDRATGKTTYGNEPNVDRKCTPPWPYGTSFSEGNAVTSGDAYVYVAGSGLAFEPKPGLSAIIDGLTWTVTGVDRLSSGEQDAAWGMRLER